MRLLNPAPLPSNSADNSTVACHPNELNRVVASKRSKLHQIFEAPAKPFTGSTRAMVIYGFGASAL
ncbi:hypothetical protein [Oculatella sp. LEGE 06141]|uniref:hypothetical protein n=1 Tax=Oculatella sp. LEGE 06141 TaxID=1828648 RepID=UPI0030D8438E